MSKKGSAITTKPAKMPAEERAKKERLHATLMALSPDANAANVAAVFAPEISGAINVQEYYELLQHRNTKGDFMRTAEETLLSQAAALDLVFGSLARRAKLNMGEGHYLQAADTYMRLALRAQNQCRMTFETLAKIKNPPVVFAKQANIAHGHQQVNNGDAVPVAHVEETGSRPIELLEAPHAKPEWMDAGAARAATPGDPPMATMEAINRTKNGGR